MLDIKSLARQITSNPRTSATAAGSLVLAGLLVVYLLIMYVWGHQPLDSTFISLLGVLMLALIHSVMGFLAADSKNKLVGFVAKLIPESEQESIANSVATTVTDVIEDLKNKKPLPGQPAKK